MRKKYMNVNLPYEILKEVDDYIDGNPYFTSRAEFVKWAIHSYFIYLGELVEKDRIKNLEDG